MKEYLLNNFRAKKIKNKILIVTDHGSWLYLEEGEYKILLEGKLKQGKFFQVLEEKGIIITEENKDKIAEKLREKYSFLFQGTALHIIVPTLRCNQKCIYCHASSVPMDNKGKDMDEKTAKKTVDFIFQSPSDKISIEFQGGESLLNFEIVKYIIKYSKYLSKKLKKELKIAIVTNLFYMTPERLDFLRKEGVEICSSLDGPKEVHDYNRNIGTHNKVVKWLEEIDRASKEEKNFPPSALVTITKRSLNYSKEIIDEYVSRKINQIHLRFLNNLGYAKQDWREISYTPGEFIEFWKKSLDYIIELNKKGVKIKERGCWIILNKLFKKEPNYLELRSPCGAAIGQLLYNYNGDIYSCDEARMLGEEIFKLGNVMKNSYNEVLSSSKTCGIVASSINDNQICDSCVYKPYCGICPVCNYAEQGSLVVNIPETSRCKIYMAQFDYIFEKILKDPSARKVFMEWIEEEAL